MDNNASRIPKSDAHYVHFTDSQAELFPRCAKSYEGKATLPEVTIHVVE